MSDRRVGKDVELRDLDEEMYRRRQELLQREAENEMLLAEARDAIARKERDLYRGLDIRAQNLDEREKQILARQDELETRYNFEMRKYQQQADALREELAERENNLISMLQEAEIEREKYSEESRSSIQNNSQKFVTSALESLGSKEEKFHTISRWWSALGALSLVSAAAFAIYTMIEGAESYHRSTSSGVGYYFFTLFRGLLVVGVFGLISRYAFIFSNSYMHESLKVGERVHAIKFGEFYLDTYGAEAKWDQVKEAFAHWNISGKSAFSKVDTKDVDFGVAGPIVQAAEKVMDAATKLSKESMAKSS